MSFLVHEEMMDQILQQAKVTSDSWNITKVISTY